MSHLSQYAMLITLCAISGGCASLIPGNKNSYCQKKERVCVSVIADDKKEPGEKSAVLLTAAIPLVVDFAVKRTASELKKEADRYSASWTGFTAEDGFYDNVTTDGVGKVRMKGIQVTRYVDDKLAFQADFTVRQSDDKFAFQLTPTSVQVSKAKAKLAFWDNDLDLELDIRIEALYSCNEDVKLVEIGSLSVPIRGVKIGQVWANGGDVVRSQWFPAVPVSRSADGKRFGTGNYVVKVAVREYDDFGKKVKVVGEKLESNREKIVDFATPKQ